MPAQMIDTEGCVSSGTSTNGVPGAGASPAGSRSVPEGSTAGTASPGSAASQQPLVPHPSLGPNSARRSVRTTAFLLLSRSSPCQGEERHKWV